VSDQMRGSGTKRGGEVFIKSGKELKYLTEV